MTSPVELQALIQCQVCIDQSSAPSTRTVFDEAARALVRAGALAEDRRELLGDALYEREHQGTTAIGYGLAIPHATMEGLPGMCLVVMRHGKGLDLGAADGGPTRVLMILATPPERRTDYLRVLGHIASVARDRQWRRLIHTAESAEAIAEILWEAPGAP